MGEIAVFEKDKKPNKWIQYDVDTEVLIFYQDREDLNAIRIKAEKNARLTGANSSKLMDIYLGRKAVGGWRKIEDHKHPGLTIGGKPIEFNERNLDMFMTKSNEFARFVNEKCVDSPEFLEEGVLPNGQ